jgi:hypothetical protein
MSHQRRHIPFLVWVSAPVLLAGVLAWVVVRSTAKPATADNSQSTRPASAPAAAPASGRDLVADRMREVLEISRAPGANAGKLIEAYGRWAADPGALVPRKMILDAILKQESYVAKVASLMQAVEAATLPPEEDPLWPQAVTALAEVWNPQSLKWGLDSMLAEERPRARQLLVASLTRMALSERVDKLTEEQRMALLYDLIDIKTRAATAVRDDIEQVIRKLSPPITEI